MMGQLLPSVTNKVQCGRTYSNNFRVIKRLIITSTKKKEKRTLNLMHIVIKIIIILNNFHVDFTRHHFRFYSTN